MAAQAVQQFQHFNHKQSVPAIGALCFFKKKELPTFIQTERIQFDHLLHYGVA